jgi:hypothetical protein
MTGLLLAIALLQAPTVAVTVDDARPAVVMTLADAQAKYKQLCADGSDDKLLRALAAAINPMPDWPQFVMNGEPSVCNRNPKPVVPVIFKQEGQQ